MKQYQEQDEYLDKSHKKNKVLSKLLPCTKKNDENCSYASSSNSDTSLHWDPKVDVLDCKSLIPPIMQYSAIKPPTPNIKIFVDQTYNTRRKMTPSKHNKLSISRRYHKKLPELVRNDTFFTIQGYSLPPSMAYITKFAPRTPKDHEHLAIIKRPLFQGDFDHSPFAASGDDPLVKTIVRSKNKLNSDYITRARDRVKKIESFYKNWPWKVVTPKALESNS